MTLPADFDGLFPATLHDFLPSGNGYKVRVMLTRLGLRFVYREVDLTKGGSRTPEFRAINPIGKVPTLVLADGTVLCESNSILWWLAEGGELVPPTRLGRQRVLQWMSFEQYSFEPTVAVRRARILHPEFGTLTDEQSQDLLERGNEALGILERALTRSEFLADDRFTIADVALYAYAHVAEEGGYSLEPFPAVRAWLARVRAELPDLPIDRVPA